MRYVCIGKNNKSKRAIAVVLTCFSAYLVEYIAEKIETGIAGAIRRIVLFAYPSG
jgi:hypothetical protein